ncbi:hypothetical protein BH23ACT7_BH23ACT7_27880 [soil metagenome]
MIGFPSSCTGEIRTRRGTLWDWDWDSAAEDTPEEIYVFWQDAVERSRSVAEALADGGLDRLDQRTWPDGRAPSLRRILIDVMEEYARHVGHADLIRSRWTGSPAKIRRADGGGGLARVARGNSTTAPATMKPRHVHQAPAEEVPGPAVDAAGGQGRRKAVRSACRAGPAASTPARPCGAGSGVTMAPASAAISAPAAQSHRDGVSSK